MYCILYSFSVKSVHEKAFRAAWRELSELIYEHAGSLGSRLHQTTEGLYLAYAQWPDKETYDAADTKLPRKANELSLRMRSFCHEVEVLCRMEMVEDLLKTVTK